MRTKSFPGKYSRFPASFEGIDVNCCKFTTCESFGIPANSNRYSKDEIYTDTNSLTNNTQKTKRDPLYAIVGSGKQEAMIKCKACEQRNKGKIGKLGSTFYTIKSNKAVFEELERISAYLKVKSIQCPNHDCSTYTEGKEAKFKKRGLTAAGTQRYICGYCNQSFTMDVKNRKRSRSSINKRVFLSLVNRSPLARIAKIYDISFQTLYSKISFFRRQCLAFVAERERRLETMHIERLYLCTDRQIEISNWTNRKEKKNIEMYGIGTACLNSDYIFAYNYNYDISVDPVTTEEEAEACGDYDLPKHHRKFARVWLKREFDEAAKKKPKSELEAKAMSIEQAIELKIQSDEENNQDLASEDIDLLSKKPAKGMLVHNEYTQIAHFYFLKRLFKNVEKTRFYMDLDAGMKNAYISAFREEIQSGDSDGFIVKTTKNTTQEEKRKFRKNSIKNINELKGVSFDDLSAPERKNIIASIIEDELDNLLVIKDSTERWLKHPLATLNEPEKMIAAVTPINRYDKTHQAHLYRKATLHPIDRFFMQIRRSVLLFERPMSSGSNAGRVWNGYGAYNPDMYNILSDIYRVYYNYVEIGKDGKTPAMRMGLAKGPVSIEKIIYFARK